MSKRTNIIARNALSVIQYILVSAAVFSIFPLMIDFITTGQWVAINAIALASAFAAEFAKEAMV